MSNYSDPEYNEYSDPEYLPDEEKLMPPSTEPPQLRRQALVTPATATTAYGLLVAYGPGLDGAVISLAQGPPWNLAWMFTALAWLSTTTVVSAMVWILAGLTALVLVTGALANGFGVRTKLTEPVARAATVVAAVPLALLALPVVLTVAVWLLTWVSTGFGTCVEPECTATPAVP